MPNFFSYLMGSLVEWFVIYYYSENMFLSSKKIKRSEGIVLGISLLYFFAMFFEDVWINAIFFITLLFLTLVFVYGQVWYSSLFHSTFIMSIMSLSELAIYSLVSVFVPHFVYERNQVDTFFVFSILSKLFFLIIMISMVYAIRLKKSSISQNEKTIVFLFFIPLFSIVIMFICIYIVENSDLFPLAKTLISICSVLLLLINILIFALNQYNQKKYAQYLELQLMYQQESNKLDYYKTLLNEKESQKILLHDIKNHLQAIREISQQYKNERVICYVDNLLKSPALEKKTEYCDNNLLNALLCRSAKICEEKNIAFSADIRFGLLNFVEDNDLTSLFGNLIENATEAAALVCDGFIDVSVSNSIGTPFVIISIINSCDITPFDKENNIIVSRKRDKNVHGLGLKSVKKVVRKYSGDIKMYYDVGTNTFHSIITIKP